MDLTTLTLPELQAKLEQARTDAKALPFVYDRLDDLNRAEADNHALQDLLGLEIARRQPTNTAPRSAPNRHQQSVAYATITMVSPAFRKPELQGLSEVDFRTHVIRMAIDEARLEGIQLGLEAAAKLVEDGFTRPVRTAWRKDGLPSKHDKCPHGVWAYEDCEQCVPAAIRALQPSDVVDGK